MVLNSIEWNRKSDEDKQASRSSLQSEEEENKTADMIRQIQTESEIELDVLRLQKETEQCRSFRCQICLEAFEDEFDIIPL